MTSKKIKYAYDMMQDKMYKYGISLEDSNIIEENKKENVENYKEESNENKKENIENHIEESNENDDSSKGNKKKLFSILTIVFVLGVVTGILLRLIF